MARTLYQRLAYSAFAAGIFSFLGPGLHVSTNPGTPRGELATEAAALGVVIGLAGIVLALVARKGLARAAEKKGTGWAKTGLVRGTLS